MAGISAVQLGGYLLEEIIAWMLKSSGYRLLTLDTDDPVELVNGSNGLRVRGRGAQHQADVLGELMYVPPFSLPLRMFVEAKCYRSERVGLAAIRNAHGVIHDVNQNWATSSRPNQPRQRYHYLYSMFSTSGFTADAQEYAQAHQIVLVDLSTPVFDDLRDAVRDAARALIGAVPSERPKEPFPVGWVRTALRGRLGTAASDRAPASDANSAWRRALLGREIDALAAFITDQWQARMLLGFPAAPLVLPMLVSDMQATVKALSRKRLQRVRLRHVGATETAGSWLAESADGLVQLRFSLPDRIESWIVEDPEEYRIRRAAYKQLLSDITIVYAGGNDVQIYRLTYDAADWRRG
ncbi:restriction endonuclease [Micromonospora profundi]|uniref:restriction endonuclease n=1 Tax=Micromonospora profundi TaxID=1420889 RepID=UPI0036CB5294